jgi:hypothetical protein
MSVDLPAPFSPTSEDLALVEFEIDAVEGLDPREPLADPLDLEELTHAFTRLTR